MVSFLFRSLAEDLLVFFSNSCDSRKNNCVTGEFNSRFCWKNRYHTHPFVICMRSVYTCQLFLRYRREIFILGVLGFLKMTRSFPNIPEEVRSLPKKSEVFRRHPKSSEDVSEVCRRRSYRENAYPQGPTLVDNISAIVLKSESFRLTWSIF